MSQKNWQNKGNKLHIGTGEEGIQQQALQKEQDAAYRYEIIQKSKATAVMLLLNSNIPSMSLEEKLFIGNNASPSEVHS